MTDCRACTRPTPDQATLCTTCGQELAQALGDVPALVEQLEIVLARQTAYGDRVGGRGADKPLPYDQDASVMLDALRNTLSTWVRAIANDVGYDGYPTNDLPAMARWLLARLERIRHHEAGDQLHDEITAITAACWRAVDRPSGQVHLGPCGGECGGELTLIPGTETAACTSCRRELAHDDLAASIDHHLGTATEVTSLLRILGHRLGDSTVRQWAARDRLTAHGANTTGRPLYRVGDVRELIGKSQQAARTA